MKLNPEQLATYRATAHRRWEQERLQIQDRERRAWQLAREAAKLLKEQYGATRVVVFGSLVHPECFHVESDLDLAAWGIAPSETFHAIGNLLDLDPDIPVNLVDIEAWSPELRTVIEQEGGGGVIERYLVLAGLVRQELKEIERVVARTERAMSRVRQHTEDADLYLDAVVLNLHDFYGGASFSACSGSNQSERMSLRQWNTGFTHRFTQTDPSTYIRVNLYSIRVNLCSMPF